MLMQKGLPNHAGIIGQALPTDNPIPPHTPTMTLSYPRNTPISLYLHINPQSAAQHYPSPDHFYSTLLIPSKNIPPPTSIQSKLTYISDSPHHHVLLPRFHEDRPGCQGDSDSATSGIKPSTVPATALYQISNRHPWVKETNSVTTQFNEPNMRQHQQTTPTELMKPTNKHKVQNAPPISNNYPIPKEL